MAQIGEFLERVAGAALVGRTQEENLHTLHQALLGGKQWGLGVPDPGFKSGFAGPVPEPAPDPEPLPGAEREPVPVAAGARGWAAAARRVWRAAEAPGKE